MDGSTDCTCLRDVDENENAFHVEKVVLAEVSVDQAALVIHVAHAHHALNVRVLRWKRNITARNQAAQRQQKKKAPTTAVVVFVFS